MISSIAPDSGTQFALANDMLRLAAVAHSVEGRLEPSAATGRKALARCHTLAAVRTVG